MQRVAENYRKIRNTFRYILGNLGDFDPQSDAVAFENMEALDQYMLCQTQAFAADVRSSYDEFAFHKIYHRLNHFCIVDLSAFYFDVLKDRLYISSPKSQARRSAQTAIWRIGEALVRLLAPIMSFTSEEVWDYLPKAAGRSESVHLALFPSAAEILGASECWQGLRREDRPGLDDAPLRARRGSQSARRSPQQQADRHRPRGPGHGGCGRPGLFGAGSATPVNFATSSSSLR